MQKVLDYVLANAEKNNPSSILETIDKFTIESGEFLMNVGPEKGKILQSTLMKHNPIRILELGAFIGYSAILIASSVDNNASLYSIDPDQNSINISQKMVDFAGLSNKVSFINSTAEFDDEDNVIDFIEYLKKKRDNLKVQDTLGELQKIAKNKDNIMPSIINCVKNNCTLGEISDTLRLVFGEY
mgnify:CR=1 FL=1